MNLATDYHFFDVPQRYERCSVLITSNLPFSKWEMMFKDPMTTAAAIDQFIEYMKKKHPSKIAINYSKGSEITTPQKKLLLIK